MFQRLPLQKLHDDEPPAFMFADVVNAANVGMIEGGGGASFAAEALDGLRISRHRVGEKLQSDVAAQAGVLGPIHYPHAAAAQLLHDAVMRDGLPDHDETQRRRPHQSSRVFILG